MVEYAQVQADGMHADIQRAHAHVHEKKTTIQFSNKIIFNSINN